jgi:BCD family chlorophyll transporter-like MFS transporter
MSSQPASKTPLQAGRFLIPRMALFQFGFGLLSVLVLGVLNRVMFAEIGLPASLVGLLLAIPSLMSPVRLWLGYLSDSHPILGLRRLPYILAGTVGGAVGVLGATLGTLSIPGSIALGVVSTAVSFGLYGIGKSAMATAFQAMVADVFDESQRGKATATLQAAFIFGIVAGSLGLGELLDPYSPGRLVAIVSIVGLAAVLLAILGCTGVEPRGNAVKTVSEQVREVPFRATLRHLFRNPQARLFFLFVGTVLLATLSQDIFLEPYAAVVFDMSVAETTRLNIFWGTGTLGSMMLCGLFMINRFGRKPMAGIGLVIVALAFTGFIVAGALGEKGLFVSLVFLLGIGSGFSASGALTLMVDFTTTESAGLLMGAWTLAHQLAEVGGNLLGGVMVDSVLAVSGSYLAAFSSMFALEVLASITAILLLTRISVSAFVERGTGVPHSQSATASQ